MDEKDQGGSGIASSFLFYFMQHDPFGFPWSMWGHSQPAGIPGRSSNVIMVADMVAMSFL